MSRTPITHRLLAHTGGRVLRLLLRPRVEGAANLPADGPFIIASNHLSFADSFTLSPLIPRRVVYLVEAGYFEMPGPFGRLVRRGLFALGNVPIRRGPTRAAVRALEQASTVLTEGGTVAIYPEGSRSPDGRLYRGRTGVAWMALASGVRIVPVAIEGTERIMPVGTRLPRLGTRPIVRFGEPMDVSRYRGLPPGKARRAVTDEVMEAIRKLSGQPLAGVSNPRADE